MFHFLFVKQQIFERILYIWAIRHPASGYVQGINDLVTPFFVVFLSAYVGKLIKITRFNRLYFPFSEDLFLNFAYFD